MQQAGMRLAADIGGTFTDVAAFDDRTGRLLLGKALSTPASLVDGISEGVAKAGARFADAGIFLHGSTIAINTMLERTGARTALITTKGFRDVYEIGRINRPDAYNLYFKKHDPLVRRSLRFEVPERLSAEGEELAPLDEAALGAVCDQLVALGIEAVAIMFLHSYRNPAHEMRAKAVVEQRLPGVFVSASHELSQEYREFERTSTVVANAYVGPRVSGYVTGIESHIAEQRFAGSFLLVQSTGGLYEAAEGKTQCIRMLESGPAAGVIGAQALARATGLDNAIAFDMGGTTAKAGVIYKGEPLTSSLALIGGYERALPIQTAMMDIFEVGTGGGSIAGVDVSGSLRVGPKSAGAEPGPACYGRGGKLPTVTDANLVLGRLGAASFLGGELQLDIGAARRALDEHVARPLGLTIEEAADGVLRIAATAMSYAVKGVSTERGLDAAAFPMIAYGGAGPLHAVQIAREIGTPRVIIPRAPGHFCAFGMLFADLRYDYVRTWPVRLAALDFAGVEQIYGELERQGLAKLGSDPARSASRTQSYGSVAGSDPIVPAVLTHRAADMRYVGQEHAVTVDLPMSLFETADHDGIKRRFDAEHERRYGTSAPAEQAEIVSLRATVTGQMPKPPLERIEAGSERPVRAALRGERPVHFPDSTVPHATPVFARDSLLAGNRIPGPAIIEEHASTTVVFPGDVLTVDAFGDLVIEVGR